MRICVGTTECLGQDADHLAINALAMALNVHLEIAYLDGTPGDLNHHHFNEEGAPKISLLYRPGHYDVLVAKHTCFVFFLRI